MDKNKILEVESLLNDYTKEQVLEIISGIEEQEVLYVYAYNYNWDNGFEIPQLILDNEKCNLSIALLIFYRADGVSYLFNKSYNENLQLWYIFIEKLYNTILTKVYKDDKKIKFKIPLSKVQLFKLKKILTEQENVFIRDTEGKELDICL